MNYEIERKFLVLSDQYKAEASNSLYIAQGYLCSAPQRTVRIRVAGEKGYITIKGSGNESGTTRLEWEKEIPAEEANELLQLCEPGRIEKRRYFISNGNLTFEVDEFYGDNQGLTIAEIELPDEDTPFERPEWLGNEVTGDKRYYNAMLSTHPYNTWIQEEQS